MVPHAFKMDHEYRLDARRLGSRVQQVAGLFLCCLAVLVSCSRAVNVPSKEVVVDLRASWQATSLLHEAGETVVRCLVDCQVCVN